MQAFVFERSKCMDTIERNLAYFKEKHNDIYKAYAEFGKMLHEEGGPLDAKTRWLIKIATSTSCQNPYALKTHIRKALKNGCSRDEVEHAILLTAPTAGFPVMMEGILVLQETLGDTDEVVMTE
jgi:alkylhydroperoxidase/carboxymuconolactone decarboxylase family protein YurZ